MDSFWADADVISSYSRAQAIEDGLLFDVMAEPETARMVREAGIRFPVALTAAAFTKAVAPILDHDEAESRAKSLPPCQDFKGRLWDVLYLLAWTIRRSAGGTCLTFPVRVRRQKGYEGATRTGMEVVHLKAVCGPGDDAEPVITIMLPHED